MSLSLRERLLESARIPNLVPVSCPKLGLTVYVNGSMTVADRLEIARLSKDRDDITVEVVVLAARDEAGAPLFTSDDTEAVAAMDGQTLQAIAAAAIRVNGMAAGSAEEARKN